MFNVCILTRTECKKNSDTRVLKEASTLRQAGYDIRIIAYQGISGKPYEEIDGFRIFRVKLGMVWLKYLRKLIPSQPSESYKVGADNNGAQNREFNSRKQGIVFLAKSILSRFVTSILGLMRAIASYFCYLVYYYQSFMLLRKEPVDIYHAHDLMTLPVAWLAKTIRKGKVVYDCHELWLDRNRQPKRSRINRFLIRNIEAFLIRRVDAVITVSQSIADVLSERYHIPKPTVIINAPYYSPVQRSDILRNEIGIPAESKIILYIGAITFNRGLEELFQSFKYLSNCSLVLMGYGDADYISNLRRLISEEKLTDRVHFFGPVPYEEVPRYAASADMGAAPIKNACLSYYYCSPNKVFECVAAGLPVVGSNFPDLKRVIEGYRLGVTFDPESPQDIARAIQYVLSDEARYDEMRNNALEAAKIYNWQNESKKLLVVYERLMGKNKNEIRFESTA